MTLEKPYFMENAAWFYFDRAEWRYKLTAEAPADARKSYEEFYSALERMDEGEEI